jgi:hypothetical protein
MDYEGGGGFMDFGSDIARAIGALDIVLNTERLEMERSVVK